MSFLQRNATLWFENHLKYSFQRMIYINIYKDQYIHVDETSSLSLVSKPEVQTFVTLVLCS